jgi:methionine-rich copper-binding protein CopC
VIIIIFLCLGINNVFAHITLENKTLATIQELKNARDNVKIQFSYSPERPLIYNETKLIFSIQDLTTGNHIKDLIASITIIKNDRIFFKFNNMAIHNGDLSLKVRFLEDGNYQVINQISSIDNIAVALASFDILVPLQPIGKFNVDSLGQLLIPAGLVAMGLSVSVIALILISRRRRKAEKLESKKYKENKSGT